VPVATAGFTFPRERMPEYTIPRTPMPQDLLFDDGLVGDAARGEQIYSRSACIGCHVIRGNPMSVGIIGPSLTHIASRHTIAGGLFPNDPAHMARWIKNSRKAKPGVLMPTLGRGEYDPIMQNTVTQGALDDQQIADIVAYLQTLK
jgi:cytochrome c oxidase subunit 2